MKAICIAAAAAAAVNVDAAPYYTPNLDVIGWNQNYNLNTKKPLKKPNKTLKSFMKKASRQLQWLLNDSDQEELGPDDFENHGAQEDEQGEEGPTTLPPRPKKKLGRQLKFNYTLNDYDSEEDYPWRPRPKTAEMVN